MANRRGKEKGARSDLWNPGWGEYSWPKSAAEKCRNRMKIIEEEYNQQLRDNGKKLV